MPHFRERSMPKKHFFCRPSRHLGRGDMHAGTTNSGATQCTVTHASAFTAIVSSKRATGYPSTAASSKIRTPSTPPFQPEGAVGLTLPIPVRRTIEIGPRGPKVPLLSGWLPPKNVSPCSKDDQPGAWSQRSKVLNRAGFSSTTGFANPAGISLATPTTPLRVSPLAQRVKATCYA
eukprot:Gregarina_sp_Poly_1__9904@NODE_647_length_6971_cov_180_164253_g493_i0_p6_GENE_NODE_647_length_6971_cov_180_164253_g493_i0NODE_647_length_6971_cov_180_164253_g493_i0_p6_ORF_typecomplete_len176_score10_25_NODE_647_length_6971_cov_180_164253_g493_i022532780